MGSLARKKFGENIRDIHLLMDHYGRDEFFADAGVSKIPDRVDVLFRSAVVLMVSHWEAYIEDICDEALHQIVTHAKNAHALSANMKRHIAKELKASDNELEIWSIADDGWRRILLDRASKMRDARNRAFNSPNAHQVSDFVERTLGLKGIEEAWVFLECPYTESVDTLNKLIEVRGGIAHRGKTETKIDRLWVEDHLGFLESIASKTGGRINAHVKKITGKSLWKKD